MSSSDSDAFWIVNWSTDCDGRCDRIDPEWRRITGQNADAALGMGWLATIHPDDREKVTAALARAAEAARPFKSVARLRRADGSFRWAMAVGSPSRDGQGALVGFVGSLIDFHSQVEAGRELVETRRRLEAIMDAAPVGLSYSSDSACEYITGNRTLFSQFDVGRDDNMSASSPNPADAGRRVRFFRSGQEVTAEELPLQIAVRERREVAPLELEVCLPNGRRWIAEASAAPIITKDGSLLGGVAVTVDVTERKKNIEALQASEARYRSLFETSRDGIVAVDMDGHIVEANPAFQALLGYRLDELKRLTYVDITPDIWREMEADILREQVLPHGESAEYEKEYIRKDGTIFPVSLRTWTVTDPNGRIVGMRAFVRDISERAKAEAALRDSQERFRALVHASSNVVYRMSADWTEMKLLAGRDFIADTHQPNRTWLQKYVPAEDHPQVTAAIGDAIRRKGVFDLEHRVRLVEGGVGWTHSRAIPILDDSGAIREWFGMASDITARKQAEEELREADRRKEEFIAMLAHELRNPLAPLRSGLEVIRSASLDEAKKERMHAIMMRQLGHLIRLVDDLLDISRINHGRIELRKICVDVSEIVNDAVAANQSLLDDRGHRLSVSLPSAPLRLEADPVRLVQVLTNLLNNAAKYTEAGGKIEIAARPEEGSAIISVRDNGSGMEPYMIPGLFDLFARIDGKLEYGGLGIGLALVRTLVELHGGEVEARSDGIGKGSEFVVRLPMPA